MTHLSRVKTSTILQMESAECGAVALGIVLAHYGKWVTLEQLREDCAVSRDGSSAANILKAAELHGLTAKGYKAELSTLKNFNMPAVIHWNFNHFVVLEGAKDDQYFINDPAFGARTVGHEEFNKSFTGVLLSLTPAKEFKPGGQPPRLLSALLGYMSSVKSLFMLVFILGLLMIVPGVTIPTLSRLFVDYYLVHHYDNWCIPIILGLIGCGLFQALVLYMQKNLMLTLESRLSIDLTGAFLKKALMLPVKFFSQRLGAEVGGRTSLIDRLSQLISGPLGEVSIGLITASIYLLVMCFYDIITTLAVVVIATMNVAFFSWQARRLRDLNQAYIMENSKLSGASMQGLQMLEDYKANGAEHLLFSRLIGYRAKLLNHLRKLTAQRSALSAIPSFLLVFGQALLFIIGGYRVIEGDMTLGMLVAFQGLMIQFMIPLGTMLDSLDEMQEAQGNLSRIDDIMVQESCPMSSWENSFSENKKLNGHLQVNNITFGYRPFAPPLLKDFSLDIPPGKWVGLIGESGSGKSTLARLINGLYQPWSGEILIDGQPIDQIPGEVLRASVGIVDQNIILFNASIKENINFWDPCIPEDAVVASAKKAEIHDIVFHKPLGYQTKLSENGKNLSGGERARVEIARSLAGSPNFLILDEATSGLDAMTEQNIIANIRRECNGGIIISHRLSAVRDCEEIIVFKEGQPVQRGRHEELIKTEGPYLNLVRNE